MSEEQETTGTEEAVQPTEFDLLSPEERGDVVEDSADEQELVEVTLLGKITWEDGEGAEVLSYVGSPEIEWVKAPPNRIANGETVEFDIKAEIVDGHEVTGTIELSGDIKLFFDMNGEENHVSYSQMIGPTITAQINQGPHAVAQWKVSR